MTFIEDYQVAEAEALTAAERAMARVCWFDAVELRPITRWNWIVGEEGDMFLLFINGQEVGLVYRDTPVWEWVRLFNGEVL